MRRTKRSRSPRSATLPIGRALNLERAMRPPIASADISSAATSMASAASRIVGRGRAQRWVFAAPAPLLRYVAAKGSICVDGVSLTVNASTMPASKSRWCRTRSRTRRSPRHAVGDAVNLEVDMVARYVERLLKARPKRETHA
jgi:riboflavin synthase